MSLKFKAGNRKSVLPMNISENSELVYNREIACANKWVSRDDLSPEARKEPRH